MRPIAICNGPKRTIFANSGLRLLQKVSAPDTERCVSEDAGPKRVDCEIPHRLERGMKRFLSECGNLSLADTF